MLPLFTTLKPFHAHTAIIQENALASWKRLGPSVETLILGNDEGTAAAAAEAIFSSGYLRPAPGLSFQERGRPSSQTGVRRNSRTRQGRLARASFAT